MMNAKQIITHVLRITEQSYTVCPVELAASVKAAGVAAGLVVLTGCYDTENNTVVLYTAN